MIREEMKNRINMALKDPILQQGFEIICKENAELKEKLNFSTQYYQGEKAKEQLTKAKEIMQRLLDVANFYSIHRDKSALMDVTPIYEAEQFLNNEVEK